MPLIGIVPRHAATPPLADIYHEIEHALGHIPDALALFSASPVLLEQQWRLMAYYKDHPTLPFHVLALMRLIVAERLQCLYCVDFARILLVNYCNFTSQQLDGVESRLDELALEPRDLELLRFVVESTASQRPASATQIRQLLEFGWTEQDVLDILNAAVRSIGTDMIYNILGLEKDF